MADELVPMPSSRPTVKLIGNDGNAFAIIGACKQAAKRAGWTPQQVQQLQDEMMQSDYDHLLATATRYFEVE